jgi:hypothetical protein
VKRLPPFLLVLLAACARPLPELPVSMVPTPDAADVETVLFLFGDAGYADFARNPVLPVLAADIEQWSARLARDSAVAVLFLGDIVYPSGVRPPDHPLWARDSVIVHNQVALVSGPSAQQHATLGLFVAGNHDWGEARSTAGVRRLQNLEEFLDRRRAEGAAVSLEPRAGEPGPVVIDLGTRLRLLLLDTAWWMLADREEAKQRAFRDTEAAIAGAGGREIVVAAHHPFITASSHGGAIPIRRTFGLRFLLNRSGAILQDLSSAPYRELRNGMLRAFSVRQPLVFAGGHDHNLQVIEADSLTHPRFNIVSGSGSKVTDVGHVEGMLFRRAAPGYAKLVVHRSGRIDVFVTAAPDRGYLQCDGSADAMASCMEERVPAFSTVFGKRIR